MPAIRTPRVVNVAAERLKAFKKYNDINTSNDPVVKKFREDQEREKNKERITASEVTQQVISSITRDKVTKKGKKTTVSNFLLSSSTHFDDVEQSPQPQSEQPVKVEERPKVYNLRNKKTVANNLGMKISLFDKSFERDQL
jgi:hypothetical protein